MDATKEAVIEFLKKEYEENDLQFQVEEASRDFLDDGWEEEFEDEYEAHQETGHGEAESQVSVTIQNEILSQLDLTYEEYCEKIGEDVWETITSVYDFLDH